ncbi:Sir2 family NAD-dependent protein deacetylase [Rhodanobacter glycinis]|uniref:Sir2 family NAD-dependent protein deacetylase n=1 Tax=Rhodanobacter glycinis TaxID=582702 RepID=A0A502BX64_9GAMM|nr:SIR2 family protein [Rhodanobacter glycinis]TPG05058.1 Sir2 family NAD-dependent protein deacetylase [Rhodanobacter glycinis]
MEGLIRAYQERRLILFVGAGLSMGLGLPSWEKLVDRMAVELGYDPDIFRTYGSAPTLAEFYRLEKGHFGHWRSEVDKEWHNAKIDIATSKAHELITKSHIDLIYTTNFDRWIELAYEHWGKPYSKIVGVDDIARAKPEATHIVKFHGDFEDDGSLVLGEAGYLERMQFESSLDIKLRSDVLGRSVLFVGYSLSDPNIRLIFYKLAQLCRVLPRFRGQLS